MTIKAVVFDAYGTLYDIQSVARVTEQAFPGYGEIITQIWRIKQLEYTWLRSLMRRYEDFSVVTRESLTYTLKVLGLKHGASVFERIMEKYLDLDLYPDAAATLAAMQGRKLAILSNGSPDMLGALVRNSGLAGVLDATISVDAQKIFKPSPDAYALIESTLGVAPADVLFVSSNPWDACGAKAFGLKVAWIERVTPEAMALACIKNDVVPPLTMFKAIRTQMDELGLEPDYRIRALAELPGLVGLRSFRSPDAAQRVALAERCAAEPGPPRTSTEGTGPGSAKRHEECRIAPGTTGETKNEQAIRVSPNRLLVEDLTAFGYPRPAPLLAAGDHVFFEDRTAGPANRSTAKSSIFTFLPVCAMKRQKRSGTPRQKPSP